MSTTRPQLSIALQSDKSTLAYGELAQRIEALGFDGLSVYSDLGYQPPLASLVTAAAHTQRLRLGPSCLNPYLLHPIEIAGQHATLDDASNGRAYLGLARGSWLDRIGVHQGKPIAHLEDAIEIVRRLLRGDDSGYEGKAFSIAPGMALHYEPVRTEVDVLLGVWGPRGAELAGRVAQEVKIGGSANPLMVALMRSWLDESSMAAGRGAGAVDVTAGAVTVVDLDGDVARGLARREVAMYVDVVAALDPTVTIDPQMLTRLRELLAEGKADAAGALLPQDVLHRFAFVGTPEEIANHTLELIEAGAARVEYGTPHGLTGPGGIELLGTRVLPAVRAGLGAN